MEQIKLCWDITKASLRCQKGQGMVEYGLIIALIAVVSVVMIGNIGQKLLAAFTTINSKI